MKLFERVLWLFCKLKKVKKTSLVNEPFKVVCFFSNTALGDTIFNTPVFRVFRQNFPHVKTLALLNPSTAELFKTDPNIDEFLLYNGKKGSFFRALRELKGKKPDIVFLLHSNEPQATPLAVLSGAKYIFKLPNLNNIFNAFHSNPPTPYGQERYVVLNRLEQLAFVGVKSADTRLRLFLQDGDFAAVDERLQRRASEKIVGFQMGASTLSRQWFKQRWAQLARFILQDENVRIVLTGSPAERAMTEELERELGEFGGERVLNLAGVFDIRQAAALIARLDILVTPDTGPLHVAAAVGTPTIGLFAVAPPINSNPNFDEHIHKFIKKPRTCEPCVGKNCKFQECMLQISASEVYKIFKEMT
ncbi:glycosyltransferase family 9 protein [Campylobacter curvus]|uniref:glycosyltransferase family 9 protein n=1 Tax=Campylobacter curvus TaxID=200 RepID=UPI00146FF7B4|nr:glycosyltransferase family 9 protein [Campylobacter curvus]